MREITRSVKVALKCLIAVVLVDVDLQYWTSKVEHLVAFAATVWPFDLEQLLCMAGHVPNIATKFEDRTPVSSWFMSHDVSRWLPLRMRTRPLRMRRITWQVSRGQKQLHFWNPRPWFAYSLCIFGDYTINVIKVICENNARPCVKRRMSFCACAKSRDLLKVP